MGSQLPAGGQGGLTPEALEAIRQLGMQAQAPQPVATPTPAPAPAQPQGQGWMNWLMSLFAPSTKSLAGPQPAMTAPPTPEELQRRQQQFAAPQQ